MTNSSRLEILAVTVAALQHGLSGGMERYFDLVISGLAELGHSVTLVTTELPGGAGIGPQVTLVPLPVRRGDRNGWNKELRRLLPRCTPSPDVVLTNSFAVTALVGCQVPIVSLIHGSGLVDLLTSLRMMARGQASPLRVARDIVSVVSDSIPTQKRMLRSSARVVAVSEETKRSLVRIYGLDKDGITVIPSPVDTRLFVPAASTAPALPCAERPLAILTAGTLTRQKGFDYVLDACSLLERRHPSCYRLSVAGDGPERERLEKRVRVLSHCCPVVFEGLLGQTQMARVFQQSDLFVLATLREEGFPLVISESLASGVPVIATAVGGNPSAVRDGVDGFLIREVSAEAIAEKIERLGNDVALRSRMAKNARARALAELDSAVVTRRMEAVLREAAHFRVTNDE